MNKNLAEFRKVRKSELRQRLKWPVALLAWSLTAFCIAALTMPRAWQRVGDTLVQVERVLTANVGLAIGIQIASAVLIGAAAIWAIVRFQLWNTGLDTEHRKRYSLLFRTEAEARWKLRQKWEREAERGGPRP